ncbi:hypothetical protein TrLO_g14995 [Triparma laevis f. longispina]|uniref:Uncharacterized protein n=1 Tax=Triparma laevis f. longispina TaxID=1714387 RepID=A0A9W7C6P5_9STRA|nr:hypothetical protein TrLO_g14995 [Triparma laevis f. longispina]
MIRTSLLLLCIALSTHGINAEEWTKLPDPVLTAAHDYEQNCVCEPLVMSDQGTNKYRMYYRSGWGTTAVGVAFSDDGKTWERYENNPITPPGDGLGGMQPWVTNDTSSSGFWYLFTTHPDWTSGVTIRRSTDGLTNWEVVENNLSSPDGVHTYFGNRVMWKEDDLWCLLQEVGDMKGGVWEIFLYTSKDLKDWAVRRNGKPYVELQRSANSMYGGPSFETFNGQVVGKNETGYYNLYYHAGSDGNLPTDIYRASSVDVVGGEWTVENGGEAILMHSGNENKFDYDQVADPSRINDMIFYDGDNNVNATCAIGMSKKKT